jgi:hypothetical protein
MTHHCHWPTCFVEVPPAMWGCKKHWFMLPQNIRNAIWKAYRPGQEITKTPSRAYIYAAQSAQEWIKSHESYSTN